METSNGAGGPPEETADAGMPAGESGGEPVDAGSGEHHRSRYRIRRERRSPSVLLPLLIVLVGLVTMGLAIALAQMFASEAAAVDRQASTRRLITQSAKLKGEHRELQDRLAYLVRRQVPGLKAIRPEQVVPVNEGLVKDVLFTRSGTETRPRLEYQVVLHNPGPQPQRVQLKLMFFNRAGIQIGESRIGGSDRSAGGPSALDGGETASFSGEAPSDPEYGLPVYFAVVALG